MFGFWIPHLWTFELSMIYSFTNVKVKRFLNIYSNYFKLNKNKNKGNCVLFFNFAKYLFYVCVI